MYDNNKIEIWKDIEEFKGYYQVSNMGRVRRIGVYSNQCTLWDNQLPKILSEKDNGRGYKFVCICINNHHYYRYIHRMVATAFCDNPNGYNEVNHIDGNKSNNQAINLEWCTKSYNGKHAYKLGLHTVHGCYGQKKPVAQIEITTNKIIALHESVEKAAKYVGLKNYCNISACCNYAEHPERYKHPCYTAKGYIWRFATPDMQVGDTYIPAPKQSQGG